MATGKATGNLGVHVVPGKVQGLRFLQAGGDLVPLQPGRIQGCWDDKNVQPFLWLSEARQVPGRENPEPEGPAVSRRREGNPTLVNLLANEAH